MVLLTNLAREVRLQDTALLIIDRVSATVILVHGILHARQQT